MPDSTVAESAVLDLSKPVDFLQRIENILFDYHDGLIPAQVAKERIQDLVDQS